MSELKEGDKAPNFNGVDQNGDSISLDDFKNKKLILYFYQRIKFANSSNYSNHYSCADSQGIKRMFLCRVAVGEFCLGHNGQLTPDVRDSSRNVLYDTTTDSMDESKRNMFVVYHDAQAYPEYLLEYSMSN